MTTQSGIHDGLSHELRAQPTEDARDLEHYESATKEVEGGHANYHGIDTRNVLPGADEVYETKIAILNEALIDLGMGSYQWKVFLTTGLGWFVDNVCMFPCLVS